MRLERIFPQPSSGGVTIRFVLTAGGPVRLRAFDAVGREYDASSYGDFAPGVHELRWDPGEARVPFAAQVVFLRLEASGARAYSRTVRVR